MWMMSSKMVASKPPRNCKTHSHRFGGTARLLRHVAPPLHTPAQKPGSCPLLLGLCCSDVRPAGRAWRGAEPPACSLQGFGEDTGEAPAEPLHLPGLDGVKDLI